MVFEILFDATFSTLPTG